MTHGHTVYWFSATALIAFFGWTAFVGTFSSQELVLGAVSALCSAGFCVLTWRRMNLLIALRASDLAQCWRVPWYIASGGARVTVEAVKDMDGHSRARWNWCAVPFERRKDRYGVLRRVLAVIYTTASPTSIVIGIDEEQGLMLKHQLVDCDVTEMERRLGALP